MTALPPLDQFLDPTALAIVAGGTLVATLLRHPLADIGRALAALRTLPRRRFDGDALLGQLAALDRIAHRQGVVALDRTVVADADLADAVTAIVDGQSPAAIVEGLNRAQSLRIERHVAAADVWAGMAEAAPAMGLIGTLIGLASMFATLRDPAAIGSAMAIALLATLYGAVFGNLVALPIAHRLRTSARTEATERARLEAPLAALAAREAPRRAVTLASVA